MPNKNIFYKKIFKTIGVTAVILAVEITIVFLLANYLNKNIVDIKQKQRLLAIAWAERLSSVSLQNDFKKIEIFFPIIEGIFPDEDNLYFIINQLESLGERTGNRIAIQITSSQVAVDNLTGSRYVLFSASMNGNYESLKKYLKELNYSRYLVKIDSFNITGSPSVNNESNMNLTGKIFLK